MELHMNKPIYLDYNATTPHAPEVIEAMRPYLEEHFGNPSSSHWYGSEPRRAVEKARQQVAGLLGCAPEEVVFTSGGTEANNHAIKGTAWALRDRGTHIITSAVEHPAVLEVCRALAGFGFATTVLPVDGEGLVDPAAVEEAVRPGTILITIMHANNEVGAIQPLAEIAAIARRYNVIFHTDAAQSVGKIPAAVDALGVDLLSVAGHKLYAPKGIGALYIRSSVKPARFCHGAGQERGRRAGTENVTQIVGLGKACELASLNMEQHAAEMRRLRDRLAAGLTGVLPDSRVNGHPVHRLPNTLSMSFKGVEADRLIERIGGEVAVSPGAACHSGAVSISHVLSAMGIPEEWAKGTVRFSVGRMTTLAEVDRAAKVVAAAVRELRA
ncbi:MAG: cysteine desulfurase family protein [Desulfobulbaceae bacterium]|jgi:cysteine desulfurase|nr:cysteine desulfurase family protein [Desulfobulbaceae bacterium]MDY0349698.1 cysteine desulfurase family protein [Desulfobulbaceae bacterium]